jgi:hypothetical protein
MEKLLKASFLSIETMEVGRPYDVSHFNIYLNAYDHEEKENRSKKVSHLVYKGRWDVYEMRTLNGYVLLRGNLDHRVFDPILGKYIKLKDIKRGSAQLKTGETIEFEVINTGKKEPIVDLQIDGENYFTNGILSHNTTFHTYAESNTVPWERVRDFIRKVIENSRLPYVTWSPTIRVCQRHGLVTEPSSGSVCPFCLEETKTEYNKKRAQLEEKKNRLLESFKVSGDPC